MAFLSIVLISLVCGCNSATARTSGEVVPLESIWALDMPETSNVRELDNVRPQDSLVEPIRRALSWDHKASDRAGSAFIVQGDKKRALRQVYEVLTMDKERHKTTPTNKKLWVCFYSKQLSWFVHVKNVKVRGNLITIEYQFVPHETRNITEHFALIPVGGLKPGKYSVSLNELPLSKRYLDVGFRPISNSKLARQRICKPFEFTVVQIAEGKDGL